MFKVMNVYKKIMLAIIALLVIALALTFAFPKKTVALIEKLHLKSEKTLELDEVYSRNLSGNMKVYFKDKKIYYHKDGTLIATKLSDEELLRRDFEAKNANVLFKDKYIYFTDGVEGVLKVLTYEDLKDVKSFDFDEAIMFVDEKGGRLVAWLSDTFNETLRAYDDEFNERFRYKALNPILTYNVDKDFKTMQIASFDVFSSDIKASLYKEINRQGENKLLYKFNDEAIAFISDFKGMKLVATNKCLYYMQGPSIVFKKEYRVLKDIKVSDRKIYLLCDDKFMVLNDKAEVLEEYVFNQNIKNLVQYGNDYIVYSEKEIYLPYKGKYHMKDFKDEIKTIYSSGKYIAVIFEDYMTIFSIKIR